jgi:excisionase family DNA binding protein
MTEIEKAETSYTIKEVASILGVHYNTARKLVTDKRIGHFNIDSARILVPKDELEDYLKKNHIKSEY